MKSKITRIVTIASECSNGKIYVVVDRSWNGKRVFCILKSEWDEMCRQEERRNTAQIGILAVGLIEGKR